MRGTTKRLALVAASLVLVACVVLAAVRRTGKTHPRITLRDGTILVVEGFTWGTNQTLRLEPKWLTELRLKLPAGLQPLLGSRQNAISFAGISSASLWFSRFDPETERYVGISSLDGVTLDSEGTEFPSSGSFRIGTGRFGYQITFSAVDWRLRDIPFRITTGDETHRFDLPNPRWRETFPVWKANPLPQTKEVEGYRFTLRSFDPVTSAPTRLEVTQQGQDITEEFEFTTWCVDSTGNNGSDRLPASEPVWGLEVEAHPTLRYLLAKGGGKSLGRMPIPSDGEFEIANLATTSTNSNLEFACLTGPGRFCFQNGTNLIAKPVMDDSGRNKTTAGAGSWEINQNNRHTLLWLVWRDPISGGNSAGSPDLQHSHLMLHIRGRFEQTVETGVTGWSSYDDGNARFSFASYELKDTRPGEVVEIDLYRPKPISVRFTFAAPRTTREP